MQISINERLFHQNRDLKFGIIHYTKITVDSSPQMIKGRTRLYQESLYFDLADNIVTEVGGIKEWRDTLKAFSADVNRYRHSVESLYRQIAKENFLAPVQSAVDLNNFFSLQYEIPIGIYDVAALQGDITIALGDETTKYKALNGREVTLRNLLYTSDESGPFGSLYVDSKRSATTHDTTEAIQLFYLRPSMNEALANELLAAAGTMFTQVTGGEFETAVLTKQQPKFIIK